MNAQDVINPMHPIGCIGTLDEAAEPIVRLCSPRAPYVTGAIVDFSQPTGLIQTAFDAHQGWSTPVVLNSLTTLKGAINMSYNTIMVQIDVDAAATPRLTFALDLAKRFEADLIGFAAAEAQVFVPAEGGGIAAAEIMRQRTQEIEERLKVLKEEFLNAAGDSEQVSWRGLTGNPTHLFAMHARAADLLVTGVPDVASDDHRVIDAGALILSAGRPVLFAADNLAPLAAEKVLVAWNDTREARRAVIDALPFLTNAHDVAVTTIADGDQKAARDSAADAVRFLMRHGVKARSEVVGTGGANREEALAAIARELGADLVIAGGYGHSRLREWIFGGMTRSLLGDGSLHRLISN